MANLAKFGTPNQPCFIVSAINYGWLVIRDHSRSCEAA